MIEIDMDTLIVRAHEVHNDAHFSIDFQRTLRIPDDNREYSLPPGLGSFPLKHVDDYAESVPDAWNKHGGVFLPMYQAEALWLNFGSGMDYPFAVKIATGKINAISGEVWSNGLQSEEGDKRQDYLVVPEQPWIDGYCIDKGLIRQFVAMPLGKGYTAEEQLTGETEHGGIQVIAYPMKRKLYEKIERENREMIGLSYCMLPDMGLSPGGLMRQEIYEDPYGIDAWDMEHPSRCFVHILNSSQYLAITNEKPPTEPPTAEAYTRAGLPWFEYYNEMAVSLGGSEKLAGMDSVAAKGIKKGEKPLPSNGHVNPKNVVKLGKKKTNAVRDGEF